MQKIAGSSKQKTAALVLVGLSANGKVVGQWHARAKLSDADVDLVFELAKTLSLAAVADCMGISKTHTWRILNFQRRASPPVRWKRSKVSG